MERVANTTFLGDSKCRGHYEDQIILKLRKYFHREHLFVEFQDTNVS